MLDLFGEIPVTWGDIWEYLEKNHGMTQDSPRAAYFIQHYNIADKVRREKQVSAHRTPSRRRG